VRVLVTGGSGFLGTSVVAGLVEAGHEVTSADLRVPDRGFETLAELAPQPPGPVHHVVMDVRDPSRVNEVVHEWRPEVVVHLASIVTPGKDSNRAHERSVDVDGTRHVLDACLSHGVRRIVVSSSGAAYGYHADNPEWITEEQPVRGNEEFAYADHKRIVEEMLAELRESRPELEQVVLRIGTILGERVDNQITALFQRPRLLKIRGAKSPFVFIWDTDVASIIRRAVTGEVTGIFNVAGDGALTVDEIASRLGKSTMTLPEPLLRIALAVGRRLGVTAYGPEQTKFLQYRPVLDNTRLKDVFGYVPSYTSAEAFEAWRLAHRL
jgi:UDP-glucose 4-epimerase